MDGRLGLHYFTLWTFTTGTSSYQCHIGLEPKRRLRHRWLPPYGTLVNRIWFGKAPGGLTLFGFSTTAFFSTQSAFRMWEVAGMWSELGTSTAGAKPSWGGRTPQPANVRSGS